MRRSTALAFLALLAVALPALADDVDVRTDVATFARQDARTLRLDVAVGEVKVVGTASDHIDAHLTLRCEEGSRRCRERAAGLALRPLRSPGALELKIAGYDREGKRGIHHPKVLLTLEVPRD